METLELKVETDLYVPLSLSRKKGEKKESVPRLIIFFSLRIWELDNRLKKINRDQFPVDSSVNIYSSSNKLFENIGCRVKI